MWVQRKTLLQLLNGWIQRPTDELCYLCDLDVEIWNLKPSMLLESKLKEHADEPARLKHECILFDLFAQEHFSGTKLL